MNVFRVLWNNYIGTGGHGLQIEHDAVGKGLGDFLSKTFFKQLADGGVLLHGLAGFEVQHQLTPAPHLAAGTEQELHAQLRGEPRRVGRAEEAYLLRHRAGGVEPLHALGALGAAAHTVQHIVDAVFSAG